MMLQVLEGVASLRLILRSPLLPEVKTHTHVGLVETDTDAGSLRLYVRST